MRFSSNIFGMATPAGTVAIDNQHVRGSLAIFFARTRMGWVETVVDRHKEQVGTPIEVDVKALRQKILKKLERLRNAGKTGESSES
jgi:hypothetical protein